MSLARLVVTAVRVEGRSKAEVARTYQVSRRWVQELVKRFDAEGEAGLARRSRRPHTSPQRTPPALEQEIVELRKQLVDQGLDAGAHTIAYHLAQRHPDGHLPSPSTIWRILSRRGFVTPQPQKRPKSSYVRFEASMPNQRWQADITHWELADATAATQRSSTSSTTTPGCWSPPTPGPSPKLPTWWPASTRPLRPTATPPRC
jgi:transposase